MFPWHGFFHLGPGVSYPYCSRFPRWGEGVIFLPGEGSTLNGIRFPVGREEARLRRQHLVAPTPGQPQGMWSKPLPIPLTTHSTVRLLPTQGEAKFDFPSCQWNNSRPSSDPDLPSLGPIVGCPLHVGCCSPACQGAHSLWDRPEGPRDVTEEQAAELSVRETWVPGLAV